MPNIIGWSGGNESHGSRCYWARLPRRDANNLLVNYAAVKSFQLQITPARLFGYSLQNSEKDPWQIAD